MILLHLVIQLTVYAIALSLLTLLGYLADHLSRPALRRQVQREEELPDPDAVLRR